MILCVWMASLNVFNNDAGRPCRKVEAVSQYIPTNRESVARYLMQGTAVRSRTGIKSNLRRISRVLGDSITAKNCPIGESRSWKVRHVVVFRELQQIVRLSNKSLYFCTFCPRILYRASWDGELWRNWGKRIQLLVVIWTKFDVSQVGI